MPLQKAVVALAVAATVALTGPARAADKVIATLAAVSDPVYSAYFIAIAKGYYKDEGLDVDFINAGGGVATPALISGSVQFSTSSGAAISAIIRGAALKVVMTLSETVPWKLWATSPEIKTLQDLKGKQVGIATRGDLLEVSVRAALMKAGMNPDEVGFTALGFGANLRMAVLKTAMLPAVVVDDIPSEVAAATGQTGQSHVLLDIGKDIETPYLGLATTDQLISGNPDLVRRFLRATYEGLLYMKAFPEDTFRIDKARDPSVPDDALRRNIADVTSTMLESGEADLSAQQTEIAVRRQLLSLPTTGAQTPSAVFSYGLMRQVRAAIKAEGWKPTE
jgi:ABC-type nitrate/sulfonate/bicarbonate transport system substrate-binding protein